MEDWRLAVALGSFQAAEGGILCGIGIKRCRVPHDILHQRFFVLFWHGIAALQRLNYDSKSSFLLAQAADIKYKTSGNWTMVLFARDWPNKERAAFRFCFNWADSITRNKWPFFERRLDFPLISLTSFHGWNETKLDFISIPSCIFLSCIRSMYRIPSKFRWIKTKAATSTYSNSPRFLLNFNAKKSSTVRKKKWISTRVRLVFLLDVNQNTSRFQTRITTRIQLDWFKTRVVSSLHSNILEKNEKNLC